MKKLLLIAAAALAISNSNAMTTGLTPEQIAQQAKEAAEQMLDLYKRNADSLQKIWGIISLKPVGFYDLKKAIHEECDKVYQNVKDTLKNSTEKISDQQLLGLLNSLDGYASGRLTGVRLQGVTSDIFDQTKDLYKKIVSTATIFTPSKGKYTSDIVMKTPLLGQLAPLFIHKLIVCITAHNLELTKDPNFKNIQPLLEPLHGHLLPLHHGIYTTEGTQE